MRIAFFGTPDFAVPTLERVLEGPHEVVVAVTQPDRRRGRGRKTSPSPVARVAARAGIPLLRPEAVGDEEAVGTLRDAAPDLGVVVAFGQFLPKTVRELPTRGYCINAHASLLPRHRGAAPIAHALLAGDASTGVTVMRVEREMDAGPVALARETPIGSEDDTGTLGERLAVLAADAVAAALDRIVAGTLAWTEQDPALATLAPRIERSDAVLDFGQDAVALARRVRAMAPKPGARTTFAGEPLRILAAKPGLRNLGHDPGRVVREGDSVFVATGRGTLELLRLQRAGGKPLETAAFLRGHEIPDGTLLGEPPA